VKEFEENKFVVMGSSRGEVKKTALSAFSNPRAGGIIAMGVEKGDAVIAVQVTDGNGEMFIGTRKGMAIRFHESDVRPMGRVAYGVRGIALREDDSVVAMEVVSAGGTLLTVTEHGYGKRTEIDEYRVQSRGGVGVINIATSERNGEVVGVAYVQEGDELLVITQQGMILRMQTNDVRAIGRATQGVKLIDIEAEDQVVSIARLVEKEEEEPTNTTPADSGGKLGSLHLPYGFAVRLRRAYFNSYPTRLLLLQWPSAAAAAIRRAFETHYQLSSVRWSPPAQIATVLGSMGPERASWVVDLPTAAARQVARAIFFSLAIIIVSFVPVFLLEAQEGRMFRPLAFTKTSAMALASLLSITLVPVLMTLFIRGRRLKPESANPVSRFFTWLYEPILRFALRWRWMALLVNFAVVPLTIPLVFALGSEFMPPLYEGSMLYMPTSPPGMSITEATRVLQVQDKLLRRVPEVEQVFGTVGRGTTPTDNTPMGMVNTTVMLKPREQWRPGMTFEKLQADMDAQLQFPGFPNVWTQPIRNRLDMLLTGIKTPVGIKIFGADLNVIESLGREIERILQTVPGTRSVYAERVAQGYFTDIRIDRDAIARYGLRIVDVQDVIQSALGGENVTETVERRERYPVNVRYARDFRESIPALQRVLVKTPSGANVPLGQLASIELTTGPAMVRDEDAQLAGYVYVDTVTSDIGGYVDQAKGAIARNLHLPAGYSLQWTGQYEFQVRAKERLKVLIPIVFFIIFLLLYLTFHSASEATIVMLSVVYAMTGGVILQWLLGYNFSVAVWVGYIALYGVAVQTGVVMVVYLHEALDKKLRRGEPLAEGDIWDATIEGSVLRLRPKLMTVTVVMASLVPIMWSTGVGSDVMKPIAAPIIGGMVTSTIHVLIITPVIFYLMKRRALRKGTLRVSAMTH